ncbi:hypothetical protein GOQ29_00980 [Clostridium sp. D2Q-14]|uniref:hypothetical protein n=1 Tax=Anaeromonas gelatinilytica TaxID=2683194 RepID=UPI00193B9D3B|nr:hypothetical protein [Anaeromonas gelatinilytica]MBS4534186.1 hypothetical protein [Anaeromonas gelatinilytica]
MEYIKELEEITKMFIKLAEKSLKDNVIDENTYYEITFNKKKFLNEIQSKKAR